MKNITLTSDYGNASHYAAAIKGTLYKLNPIIQVIDVSHSIEKFNKLQAAFVLNAIYKNFADGTIHLICIDANVLMYKQVIVVKHQNQYFIALDNGVLDLLFNEVPNEIWIINTDFYNTNTLFAENEVFTKITQHLVSNLPLNEIAQIGTLNNQLNHQNCIIHEHGITCSVVFIDGFGNAFIDVDKNLFEQVGKGRNFKIHYARREYFSKISSHYKAEKMGEEVILFNSSGFLEIAINQGDASQLLGLRVGSKIMIDFF